MVIDDTFCSQSQPQTNPTTNCPSSWIFLCEHTHQAGQRNPMGDSFHRGIMQCNIWRVQRSILKIIQQLFLYSFAAFSTGAMMLL